MKVGIRPVAAITVAVLFGCVLARSASRRTITVDEGRELLYAMLKAGDWTKLPGFDIVVGPQHEESPDFYIMHATYECDGSGIGHFAVDKTTGDVWDWASCGRYSSPALLRIQSVIRKRIGLTDTEYRKLRRVGPFCESGEAPHILNIGRPRADAFSKAVEHRK